MPMSIGQSASENRVRIAAARRYVLQAVVYMVKTMSDLVYKSLKFVILKYNDGGLAQLVEQRNHNPRVIGPSPLPATKLQCSSRTEV